MKDISILMIDNNTQFLKHAKEFLSEQNFVKEIYTATSETTALRLTEEIQPQVILVDVLMPGRNGIDLIPLFKEKAPASKIIMLTIWDFNGYRDSSFEAGADGFVSKKTMQTALMPEMERLLGAEVNENIS